MGGRGGAGHAHAVTAGSAPIQALQPPTEQPHDPDPALPPPVEPDPPRPAPERESGHQEPPTEQARTELEPAAPARPVPEPVSGQLLDQSLTENTWGGFTSSPVHFHDDGEIGTAIKYMGAEARMDVDGQPLGDVLGKMATDVVHGRRTAQQGVDDLKVLRDRLPADSRARRCLDRAVMDMDGPDTPVPTVPAGTPEPLQRLVTQLHAVPMVRADPDRELNPVLDMCHQFATGQAHPWVMQELTWLANKRHESTGDAGKFEIDDAVRTAVRALDEQRRERRTNQ